MTTVQIISGDFNITDPGWPRYTLWKTGTVFTSDGFNNPETGEGQLSDADMGGAPHPWDINTSGFTNQGGQLKHVGTGNRFMQAPSTNMLVELKFAANTAQHSWGFYMRRPGQVFNEGWLQFHIYPEYIDIRETPVGGTTKQLARASHTIQAGDVIGFQHFDGVMSVLVNGTQVASGELTPAVHDSLQGKHFGFSTLSSKITETLIDWMKVTAL